ncbi:hypothetical protein PG987_006209 [Apiospora arundinis]
MSYQHPRRANTDLRAGSMQFNTPRGNIPYKVAQATAHAAPPAQPPTRSKYPREYRNKEGRDLDVRPLFEEWETGGRPLTAAEYAASAAVTTTTLNAPAAPAAPATPAAPVVPVANPAVPTPKSTLPDKEIPTVRRYGKPVIAAKYTEYPGAPAPEAIQRFDYHKRAARAVQVERPVHPNDRKRIVQNPHNDPGPLRVISVQDRPDQVVGAIYHPENSKEGFGRATLQPLDRTGRATVQQLRDYEMRKTQTMQNQRR